MNAAKCRVPHCDWRGKNEKLHRALKHPELPKLPAPADGSTSGLEMNPVGNDDPNSWSTTRLSHELANAQARVEQYVEILHSRMTSSI